MAHLQLLRVLRRQEFAVKTDLERDISSSSCHSKKHTAHHTFYQNVSQNRNFFLLFSENLPEKNPPHLPGLSLSPAAPWIFLDSKLTPLK